MPRNAEVTRQWKILRAIEASHAGKTLDELTEIGEVTSRTIRRDLEALQEAGFTLRDDRECEDGKVRWRLEGRPFRTLAETSFTLPELAALYFSRTLLECSVDQLFRDDLKAAFDRLDAALSPHTRDFLARLPAVLLAKNPHPAAGEDSVTVSKLMTAALTRKKATIRYHSFSSRKINEYAIEPYRLVYGNGSLYLLAYVPAYEQVRTFAVKRIKKLTVLDEVFTSVHEVSKEPFVNSLGISEGPAEHVEIVFAEAVAPYIREGVWHRSQQTTMRPDGSVVLALDVCLDRALTSWILGFGPMARVIQPLTLAEQILDEIEEAREVYVPRLSASADYAGVTTADLADSRRLPFESTADYADSRLGVGAESTVDSTDSRRLGNPGTARPREVLPFRRRKAKREPA
jgi:predicted DNA-binding transcriptional regulator YafY